MSIQPQKSEVHSVTEDASTSPATSAPETPNSPRPAGQKPSGSVRVPDVRLGQVEIVRDDSDAGGPIVLKSDDPALRHPEPPVDPFPTDRMPEIDPPVK